MKIKTDYDHIKELYLVYPEGVKEGSEHIKPEENDYSRLAPFYDNLIQLIPSDINLKLFVKSRAVARKVKDMRQNIEVMVNSKLTSIWNFV